MAHLVGGPPRTLPVICFILHVAATTRAYLIISEFSHSTHSSPYSYVEIFNTGLSPISLADYGLPACHKKCDSPTSYDYWNSFVPNTVISANGTYVVCFQPLTTIEIRQQCNEVKNFNMDGTNPFALAKGTSLQDAAILDVVGSPALSHGGQSDVGVCGLKKISERQIRRKMDVCTGSIDWATSTSPANCEWHISIPSFPQDFNVHLINSSCLRPVTTNAPTLTPTSSPSTSARQSSSSSKGSEAMIAIGVGAFLGLTLAIMVVCLVVKSGDDNEVPSGQMNDSDAAKLARFVLAGSQDLKEANAQGKWKIAAKRASQEKAVSNRHMAAGGSGAPFKGPREIGRPKQGRSGAPQSLGNFMAGNMANPGALNSAESNPTRLKPKPEEDTGGMGGSGLMAEFMLKRKERMASSRAAVEALDYN